MQDISQLGFNMKPDAASGGYILARFVFDDGKDGADHSVTTAEAQFLAFIWNNGWKLQWDERALKLFITPKDGG
jgi:hypothetical protein